MENIFKDKNILVTGRTGFIGSEIVRRVLQYEPDVVRILSRDESKQFELEQEITQLKKADKVIAMRRKNAEYLTARLKQEITEIIIPNHLKDCYHICQMYTISVNNYRDKLAKYLADSGIMTTVYFSPVHLTHFYKNELGYTCELPVTEKISEQVLTLPMYPTLTKEETDFTIDEIKSFFEVTR